MQNPTTGAARQDLALLRRRFPAGQGMAEIRASVLSSSSAERNRFSLAGVLRSSSGPCSLQRASSILESRPCSSMGSRLHHMALKGIRKPLNSKQAMTHNVSQRTSTWRREWSCLELLRGLDGLSKHKTEGLTLKAYRSGRQDGLVENVGSGGTVTKGSVQESLKQTQSEDQVNAEGGELERTQRLVETAMLAATAGLAFFLSNLFRLEGYFGCVFPLPVVISSMRYGAIAGRKTMVATALLLLILSGPLKSASYLLMHGFVGLAVGVLWRFRVNWFVSLAICTVVRCFGSLGFVLLSSWLLRENLLRLITINAHASISYMLAAVGINIIPTMMMIYVIFGILLILNCGSFVFLLHVLYVILLKRLGLETNTTAPGWVQRAA